MPDCSLASLLTCLLTSRAARLSAPQEEAADARRERNRKAALESYYKYVHSVCSLHGHSVCARCVVVPGLLGSCAWEPGACLSTWLPISCVLAAAAGRSAMRLGAGGLHTCMLLSSSAASLLGCRRKKEHTERLKREAAALQAENAALQSLLLEMSTTGEH